MSWINVGKIARMTIKEFAEKNGLTLEVKERNRQTMLMMGGLERFYASFKNVEVKTGSILSGKFGNGDNPRDAVKQYVEAISGKNLVVNAHSPNRKDIEPTYLEYVDF